MVVGGSAIKDTDEPSRECPVGGYHEWEELRTALAHVCVLCGTLSPVRCFEHPERQQPTPLRPLPVGAAGLDGTAAVQPVAPRPPAPPVAPAQRQAS
jgi:hypothetical protein